MHFRYFAFLSPSNFVAASLPHKVQAHLHGLSKHCAHFHWLGRLSVCFACDSCGRRWKQLQPRPKYSFIFQCYLPVAPCSSSCGWCPSLGRLCKVGNITASLDGRCSLSNAVSVRLFSPSVSNGNVGLPVSIDGVEKISVSSGSFLAFNVVDLILSCFSKECHPFVWQFAFQSSTAVSELLLLCLVLTFATRHPDSFLVALLFRAIF
jgi:hypothetical protein